MPSLFHTSLLTILAMIAFAANSVLARLALSGAAPIDPISYTSIRLFAAAGALMILLLMRGGSKKKISADYLSVLMLFGYAGAFSLAYLRLDTAMGALILFGVVQLTMISWGVKTGEKLSRLQVTGILLACSAFLYLMSPGLTAPDLTGAALMAVSGVCWGVYSLAGRGKGDPLARTASHFIGTLPLVIIGGGLYFWLGDMAPHLPLGGVGLAVLSGTVTSGAGYAIWYSALKGLSAAQGGIVQLSVPIIAAIGGVMFVAEPLSFRLYLSAVLILGGIALTMVKRPDRAVETPKR